MLDKGSKRDKTAMEMAQCIIENGREKLQETYPNALYKDEITDPEMLLPILRYLIRN